MSVSQLDLKKSGINNRKNTIARILKVAKTQPDSYENGLGAGPPISGDFKLCNNIPNPFSDYTYFKFYLPKKSTVKFSILNFNGEIKWQDSYDLSAGEYGIPVDLKGYPDGIYFYKMAVKSGTENIFEDTRKMLKGVDFDSRVLKRVLEIASGEVGVREEGENKGPRVEEYLKELSDDCTQERKCPPGSKWCMAFVYWCFKKACNELNVNNELVRVGHTIIHWNEADICKKILPKDVKRIPQIIKPGYIFIIDHGNGGGHTGIVEKVNGTSLTTIEGNTIEYASPDGIGVFRLNRRKISDINKGFLAYYAGIDT